MLFCKGKGIVMGRGKRLKNIQFFIGESVPSCADSMVEVLAPFDVNRYAVFPGFCDVHVHFREPGFP